GFWVAGSSSGAARSSPLEKLNVAFVGVGGRGAHNLASLSGENVVALVDVDDQALARAAIRHPKARKLHDFRRLFDSAREFDAVVVSTTEHTHAFATLPALRLNKHVYCEKPLAHSAEQTRLVAQEAGKRKVATQMGTQIHAGDNYRRVVELIAAGAVGPVKEVHVWVSRGGPGWGGGDRPKEKHPIPKHLHWDLWLGPAP